MLGIGIDWAKDFHIVALGRMGEGVTEVRRVEHGPTAGGGADGRDCSSGARSL